MSTPAAMSAMIEMDEQERRPEQRGEKKRRHRRGNDHIAGEQEHKRRRRSDDAGDHHRRRRRGAAEARASSDAAPASPGGPVPTTASTVVTADVRPFGVTDTLIDRDEEDDDMAPATAATMGRSPAHTPSFLPAASVSPSVPAGQPQPPTHRLYGGGRERSRSPRRTGHPTIADDSHVRDAIVTLSPPSAFAPASAGESLPAGGRDAVALPSGLAGVADINSQHVAALPSDDLAGVAGINSQIVSSAGQALQSVYKVSDEDNAGCTNTQGLRITSLT